MKMSFGDAMRNGRHASESGRKPQRPQVSLRLCATGAPGQTGNNRIQPDGEPLEQAESQSRRGPI